MQKKLSLIALVLMAGLLSGCAKTLAATPSTGVSSAAETTAATDVPEEVLEADRLSNHMSENERNSVSEGPLTILEEPWKKAADDPFKKEVMVEFWDSNDYINNSRSCLKRIYNMEDPETISRIQNMIKSYEEYPFPKYLCTGSANGRKVEFLPQEDYDGGKCEVYYLENSDDGSGEGKEQHKKFKDYAAFKKWYRAYLDKQVKDDGLSIIQADQKYDAWKAQRDAKIEAKKQGLTKAAADKAKAAAEAEAKVNKTRAEAIAARKAEAEEAARKAAEEAAAAAAEATETPEA
jgi:hypothetical protein